jgi:hypothetical protein
MGQGQLHQAWSYQDRTRCPRSRFAGTQRRLRVVHTTAAARRSRGHRERVGVPAERRVQLHHRSGHQRRRRPDAAPWP